MELETKGQGGPQLARVSAALGAVEISADFSQEGLTLSLWLSAGPWERLVRDSGFWVHLAGADVYFEPRGVLFNRARFEAVHTLAAEDPTPREPAVWLPGQGMPKTALA